MNPDDPQPGFDFEYLADLARSTWRDREAEQRFSTSLRAAFGDAYSDDEAERLQALAGRLFEQADDLLSWPDLEVAKLLWEAVRKVEWLESLFLGDAPAGYDLPKSAATSPHVRNPELRRLRGLDPQDLPPGASAYERALASPDRSVHRLRRLLSVAASETSRGEGWRPVWDGRAAGHVLERLKTVIEAAADRVQPERGTPNDVQRARARERLLASGVHEDRLSASLVNDVGAPFKTGRPSAPEPLVVLVRELARSWLTATGRPVRHKNDGFASRDYSAFANLLRLLEATHRRRGGELGKAVVRRALAPASSVGNRSDRSDENAS